MPKVKEGALGKGIRNRLQKGRQPETHVEQAMFYQPAEDAPVQPKLQSRLQQDNIEEFVQQVELQERRFQATKGVKLGQLIGQTVVRLDAQETPVRRQLKSLRIPRRPAWTRQMGKAQLMRLENEAFLTWRRELGLFQQQHYEQKLTPFQKNIEVWRQLWRVVEECDLLVQIVDARDPLFFRCEDLQAYVKEVGAHKKTVLLLNKADLLPPDLRKLWSDYFTEQKITHYFYSAKAEQPSAQHPLKGVDIIPSELKKIEEEPPIEQKKETQAMQLQPEQPWHLIGKLRLIQLLRGQQQKGRTVGMVGFPNVGKSSVINSLIGARKMQVGVLPGKTKHMQLFRLEEGLVLCDCPGLVFPSAGVAFPQMVLNGVIHLDNLREYYSPVALLASRIPQHAIQRKYALRIQTHSPQGILQALGLAKGLTTGRGLPNQAYAARLILKDYVEGRLVYCSPPPGSDYDNYGPPPQKIETKEAAPTASQAVPKAVQRQLDAQFFEEVQDVKEEWTQAQLLLLLQGRQVQGLVLRKEARRQLKFRMKRGQSGSELKRAVLKVHEKGK